MTSSRSSAGWRNTKRVLRRHFRRFPRFHHGAVLVAALLSLLLVVEDEPAAHRRRHTWNGLYAERVRTAARTTFSAYSLHCSGRDEYEPLSGACHDWAGIGITVLDSADTLYLMGLRNEYLAARKFAKQLDVAKNNQKTSVFEVTIRALGGLNSAYALSRDRVWLLRAVELGNALLPAFQTETGCPNPAVVLSGGYPPGAPSVSSPAEAGTLQLEMRTLSAYTGDMRYATTADRCEEVLLQTMPNNSLVPQYFDPSIGNFVGNVLSVGGGVDSFIEMLLKTWIASGKRDTALRVAFERSVEHVFDQTSYETAGLLLLGRASIQDGVVQTPDQNMEHLSCFMPAALAIAALHGLGGGVNGTADTDYMPRARRLSKTCFLMSRSNPHGLAPEEVEMSLGVMKAKHGKAESILRPEIVETLFVMHSVTKGREPQYREWGRVMWDAIEENGTLPNGRLVNSFDLNRDRPEHRGKLHSFVLAETLKYFFLLFREDGDGPDLNLNDWVFNTEAHPVLVRGRH